MNVNLSSSDGEGGHANKKQGKSARKGALSGLMHFLC